MGVDQYRSASRNIRNSAEKSFSVSPHDDNDLAVVTRGLWIGGAGDVSLILLGDTDPQLFEGVQAGSLLPFRVKRVRATGTTVTAGIIGVY